MKDFINIALRAYTITSIQRTGVVQQLEALKLKCSSNNICK